MKIDQLSYFVETARHEHIGKAAKILAISPSAVSHAIAALESELGHPLFVRDGKRILLTSHGKRMLERASSILRDLSDLKEELSSDAVESVGHFKLAATHGLAGHLLTPGWVALRQAHPKLTAEVYSMRSADVIAKASTGEIDYGLCFSPSSHPGFSAKPLHKGQLVIVVRKGHPVLKLPEKSRGPALSAFPFTAAKAFQGIDNCETHPIFAKLGITANPQFIFDSYDVAAPHVEATQSWCLVPDWVAQRRKASLVQVFQKQPEAPYEIAAVWQKSRALPRVLVALSECISAVL